MFTSITASPLPAGALLQAYEQPGHYVDCFSVQLSTSVEHSHWLRSFLHSRVFRLERQVLSTLFGAPSDDDAVASLISGQAEHFAVWTVEHRAPQELLMRDRSERTRTWWRTEPHEHGVRLYFGSAMVPAPSKDGTPVALGALRLSIPMHRAYSRLLMRSACERLQAFN